MTHTLSIGINPRGMQSIDFYLDLFTKHDLQPLRHEFNWRYNRDGNPVELMSVDFHFQHDWQVSAAYIILE